MSRVDDLDKIIDAASPSIRQIIEAEGLRVPDISEDCLDGYLGEVCARRMSDFPRAYAWPALLAAASVHVANSSSVRSNLYVALVGPVGSGKGAAMAVANHIMDVGDDLFDTYVGSAEGLAKHLPAEFGALHKLWYVDELGHMLDKARIEGASFVRVLNTAFYKNEQTLVVAKGAKHKFNAKLSIVGGVVDEDFEDAFSAITSHGLYDRFIFGCVPTDFRYNYHPMEDYGEPITGFNRNLAAIDRVNSDIWEFKKSWAVEHPLLNREFEIALRGALICATFDGRGSLSAKDLKPAMAFADAQAKVRELLRPNMGRNQGGEISQKITDYLKKYAPDGEWMRLRDVLQATHAHRYGMALVNQLLNALSVCGEIDLSEDKESYKKPRIIRLSL